MHDIEDISCEIFVDTSLSQTDLCVQLHQFVGGTPGRFMRGIITHHNRIHVLKNGYRLAGVRHSDTAAFLYYRYLLDIFPTETPLSLDEQVLFVDRILTYFEEQNMPATPVCDYEHLLKKR